MTVYLPPTSLRFRVNAGVLEYKPKPSYPTWLVAWDISDTIPLDVQDQLDAIAADVITAQGTANTALANAATAQTTANTGVTNAAAAQATANAAAAAAAAITPKNRRATMWHGESNAAPALTISVNTIYIDNHVYFSTTQFWSATHSFDCDLMPACKLFFIGVTANNHGILSFLLDGNAIGSLDWYSASTVNNVIKSISFAANAISAGRHVLTMAVTTKNGASSNYACTLTKYWLAPDTD